MADSFGDSVSLGLAYRDEDNKLLTKLLRKRRV